MAESYNFFDFNQAQSYLSGCVVLYDNKAAYVSDVSPTNDGRASLTLLTLDDQNLTRARSDSKQLNYTMPELGFVNITYKDYGFVLNILRSPARVFKIGLHSSNLVIKGYNQYVETNVINSKEIVRSKYLAELFNSNYPTFAQALASFEDANIFERAFSKRFAIGHKGKSLLHEYFSKPIGAIENGKPILFEEHSYMQEKLDIELARG